MSVESSAASGDSYSLRPRPSTEGGSPQNELVADGSPAGLLAQTRRLLREAGDVIGQLFFVIQVQFAQGETEWLARPLLAEVAQVFL